MPVAIDDQRKEKDELAHSLKFECSQSCDGSEISKRLAQLPSQACTSEISVSQVDTLTHISELHAQESRCLESRAEQSTADGDGQSRRAALHCGHVGAVAPHPLPCLPAGVSSRVRPAVEVRRAQRRVQVVDGINCKHYHKKEKWQNLISLCNAV